VDRETDYRSVFRRLSARRTIKNLGAYAAALARVEIGLADKNVRAPKSRVRAIDSHQHFWEYNPAEYPWIKPDWPIRKSFLPRDLEPLLRKCSFGGCIAVQARQSLRESEWLLELAENHPFVAGVVGWVDLRSPELEKQLERFQGRTKFVAVRHVVQDEPDDQFMLCEDFVRGIGMLQQFDLAYDILIFPRQLPAAIELVNRFPEQRFVLDHIAKPFIKDARIEPWGSQIRELAKAQNVYCKVSGMATEARWQTWSTADFRPYLDIVWQAFGPDRLMIGSDWPVCLLSGEYERTMGIVQQYLEQFGGIEREKVLGANAVRFYRLPV
jgi:L-fuconolactonase